MTRRTLRCARCTTRILCGASVWWWVIWLAEMPTLCLVPILRRLDLWKSAGAERLSGDEPAAKGWVVADADLQGGDDQQCAGV